MLRNVAEIAFGALLAVGACFNTVYTLGHSAEFYGSFADGAWLEPARRVTRELVVPNGVLVTAVIIVFQLAAAIAILSRSGLVTAGLVAGASFAVVAALFSNPAGTVGNLALAGLAVLLVVAQAT